MVVFYGLSIITTFVLAGSSCICGVYVIWVDFQDRGEVGDALLELAQAFEGATADVEGPGVALVKAQQGVAVLDGLGEAALLEERGGADQQGLAVLGVLLELLGAHGY